MTEVEVNEVFRFCLHVSMYAVGLTTKTHHASRNSQNCGQRYNAMLLPCACQTTVGQSAHMDG